MGIIFDLDQTLIDSTKVLHYREKRQWKKIYKMIPLLQPYEGINELIEGLKINKIPICIVTSSPRPYCEKIIEYWNWGIENVVCYHDTKLHKPNPDPILKGITLLRKSKKEIISVGDDKKDIIACRKANVTSVAALWGTYDKESLLKAEPDIICNTVDELVSIIESKYDVKLLKTTNT